MLRRILGDLPAWAKTDHPLLRYELQRQQSSDKRPTRLIIATGQVLLLFGFLAGGYLFATNFLTQPTGVNTTQSLWRVLYFPALALQIILSLLVLSISAGTVNDERRRQTWDNLRATEVGAAMKLRTRWVALLYRLRGLIVLILAARLVLALALLYELTSHRGGYIDLLTATVVPELPLPLGVTMMASLMTAAFLLPITQTGLEIALGLLIGAAIRNRTYSAILQVFLVVAKMLIVFGLLFIGTRFLMREIEMADSAAWLLMGGFSAFGDQGLLLMQAGQAGDLWARIPYSVLYGFALLGIVLLQAILTDGIMAYAVRRAERTE
jgi:hypothetical protein